VSFPSRPTGPGRPDDRPTLVILSQVYVPDPASVGQHMHDAAREMVRRGFRVVVYASGRGYHDPSRRYSRRDELDGVLVRRLPLGSFGKGSLAARLAGGGVFLAQALLRAIFTRRLAGVLVSTSPVMASAAGLILAHLRRVPLVFWVMDVNPDQAVATGAVDRGAWSARALESVNRAAARASSRVILLDRFMEDRLTDRWSLAGKAEILPPWSHDSHLDPVAHPDNPFRSERGWNDSLVLMYSGNISPVHPVTPILEAARLLRGEPRLRFVFIGGGAGREEVARAIERDLEQRGATNLELLPYQPLSTLRLSLSAADVHLVTMGRPMVGVVHPSKVYGALRVARPVLFVGPAESHVGEILRRSRAGWQVEPEDVAALVARIRTLLELPPEAFARIGRAASDAGEEFSEARLSRRLGEIVAEAVGKSPIAPAGTETVS